MHILKQSFLMTAAPSRIFKMIKSFSELFDILRRYLLLAPSFELLQECDKVILEESHTLSDMNLPFMTDLVLNHSLLHRSCQIFLWVQLVQERRTGWWRYGSCSWSSFRGTFNLLLFLFFFLIVDYTVKVILELLVLYCHSIDCFFMSVNLWINTLAWFTLTESLQETLINEDIERLELLNVLVLAPFLLEIWALYPLPGHIGKRSAFRHSLSLHSALIFRICTDMISWLWMEVGLIQRQRSLEILLNTVTTEKDVLIINLVI